jgi:CubicO group peptidase (beta-lactamase class C family)
MIQPFNLTNTGVFPGTPTLAAIPPVPNSWGADYGDNAPGGGLYSSLTDLSRTLHSILTRKSLTSQSAGRAWLQHTPQRPPYSLVGRPREMYHARNLTNSSQSVLIHGKNGGAYGYIAQSSLIDSLGIGIVVLTAGPPDAWTKLYDAMLSVFVPAVHEASIKQARRNGYTDHFASDDDLVHMSTSLDTDGVGIILDSLTRNGSDILAGIQTLFSATLP